MNEPVGSLELSGIKKFKSGKVREIFDLGENFLIVATDRISAFDFILPTLIPDKGKVLNKISVFWFKKTEDIIENHFITDNPAAYPEILKPFKQILHGRSMLVKKAEPIEVECVVRGYIMGSAWEEYKNRGTIAGIKFKNLQKGDRLPEPIFTPATKSHSGHDENISYEQMKQIVPAEDAEFIRGKSLELYNYAHNYALKKGIIIADTKFEFGRVNNKIILIDEIFTPDSSRFLDRAQYEKEKKLISFDKQFVRDYLLSTDWDKNSPPPALPRDIVEKTRMRYQEALKRLSES